MTQPVDSSSGNTISTTTKNAISGAITRFGGANNLRVRAIVPSCDYVALR
jgi:hypothetical protein